MRKNIVLLFSVFGLCLIATCALLGQDPISTGKDLVDQIKGAGSLEVLLTYDTAIQAFLILIAGYLSPFIPGIKNIPSTTYRVLVFAILVVVALMMFGVGDSWQGLIAYFFSTSLYELVLSKFKKTSKVEE